ncbi:O-antigen polymerase [Bradyrhizobium sp. UFLA03-84]|uniref:O-antigen ligase family protein n=1 Tax=Bradyrhizobium sp. UFLA03-84 TaxID=418599 RepID=UPI000BAE1E6B|nr:O-antigen ligase family protein [Bradyrhizobium sp. UFLA03-84]PAY05675.1 O-antigen polymerase [Bradyrhizobium sp. UFLA03-84]
MTRLRSPSGSGEATALPWPVRWSSWLFCAVVALAPLPLGSVGAVAPAIWSILLGIALLGVLPVRLRGSQLAILAVTALLTALAVLVLHEQSALRPWLGAAPNALWAEAGKLLPAVLPPVVTIATNLPFYSAGVAIVCLLAFAIGVVLGANRMLARGLLRAVALAGLAYAICGIVTFAIDPTRIYLLHEKQAHLEWLTSPFVNRNTAGIYYGCCALIWLLFGCELIERHWPSHRSGLSRLFARLDMPARRRLAGLAFGWLTCLLAMFLTGSRGGVGISLLAAVVAAAILFRKRMPRRYGLIAALGIGSLVALALLQLLGGGVGARFSTMGLSDEGRFSTYRATLRMIWDHPWLGDGIGSFEWVYPAYRTDDISLRGTWNRAHNSWLELASDGGMLMAGAAMIALLAAFGVLAHGVRTRRRDVIVPLVALCASGAGTLHSMIDFSLQITGYAVVIAALLGAGLSQSFRSGRGGGVRDAGVTAGAAG